MKAFPFFFREGSPFVQARLMKTCSATDRRLAAHTVRVTFWRVVVSHGFLASRQRLRPPPPSQCIEPG